MTDFASDNESNEAAYDVVGRYNQNKVNGFRQNLIDKMLEEADFGHALTVLDAMGGDGNLSAHIIDYCQKHSLQIPSITLFEISRVQCAFAKQQLKGHDVTIHCGNILTFLDEEKSALPLQSFDRVFIKSASHEIPLKDQARLYETVYQLLRPGGLFINLGFLFECPDERDEMNDIAQVKDECAGMLQAVTNRHFLTREELYSRLKQVGFEDVFAAHSFNYEIRSEVVANQYFAAATRQLADAKHQAVQARAFTMRRNGRIEFERDMSVMKSPGEITVARRPLHDNLNIFNKYPLLFLRHIQAHAEMLDAAVESIPKVGTTLDLGCGAGLLAERLQAFPVQYKGVDHCDSLINYCKEQFLPNPRIHFQSGNIESSLDEQDFDCITLLNVLNLPGLRSITVLKNAINNLKAGGSLVISGPLSPDSFTDAEPHIIDQLKEDGFYDDHQETIRAIQDANRRLVTEHGQYWSAAGMSQLLLQLGVASITRVETSLYYGHAFLVVAQR
ncbi:MAG: methyltransferase domain-containing protein [Planctomycetota bacterium]|nr:methyltransferase domain-containing protein [Planctomycetota bacterium]